VARKLCAESHYPPPLLAVAAYGLAGSRGFPSSPLPSSSWDTLLAAAKSHRVLGQLRAAVDAGALPVTPDQRASVRGAHRAVLLRVLSLEQHLVAVHALLAAAGVECRVLKGSAYAHLDYPEPAWRSFVDLDLLFRPSDMSAAVSTLEDAGLTRILAEPRPGFDERFDKGTTLRSPDGFEVDLHRTFVLGPWGRRVDIDALWSSGSPFVVGGRTLMALSAPHRFLHACYHAALGDWPLRLGSLRDVAQLSSDPSVIELATSWGVQAVVAAAVSDSTRLLGLPVSGAVRTWAASYVPTRREEHWLGLHTQANKTFAAQAMATLPVLPGVRDKVAYLRALVLPDAGYTGSRHRSALSRLGYGVREALRGRGRTS
jgi:hypothetical protein